MTDEFAQPDGDKPDTDAPKDPPDETPPDETTSDTPEPPAEPEKPKRRRGRPKGSRTKRKNDDGPAFQTGRAGGWVLGEHGWELPDD